VGCYIWYSEEGPGRAAAPPRPLLAVPNVTVHPQRPVYQLQIYMCLMYTDGAGIVISRMCVRVSVRKITRECVDGRRQEQGVTLYKWLNFAVDPIPDMYPVLLFQFP